MNNSLQGKKVLYVAPRFFGYEKEIEDELVRRGAEVDFVLDRPFDTPFMKAVTKLLPGLVVNFADRYYIKALQRLGDKNYDCVFVINGQTLSIKTLAQWREKFSSAKFFLYMWDSFDNRRGSVLNLKFFDQCFSFDKNDAARYQINFRPLFFSAGFELESSRTSIYDISFVGTAHTDRYSVATAVKRQLAVDNGFWYFFLQAKWVFWIYKVINPAFKLAKISEFEFNSLTKSEVQEIFFSSKIVLDIEHPGQTGLTMRTLEALGARKKLITTNASVKEYDFFSIENVCIINRDNPVIPVLFLNSSYVDVLPAYYQRYRLSGWVDEIFLSM